MPDATLREEDGKRPSQAVFDAMARVSGPLLSRNAPAHFRCTDEHSSHAFGARSSFERSCSYGWPRKARRGSSSLLFNLCRADDH